MDPFIISSGVHGEQAAPSGELAGQGSADARGGAAPGARTGIRGRNENKRAEGKKHNQAVRALGRHLVRVMWAMLTQDRDYELREDSCHS